MSARLKPCPFCGGEAKLYESVALYKVRCNDCGASAFGISVKEVVASWNRRVNDMEDDGR